MKHRHLFQNQKAANALLQLTTTNSNHTQNSNGESATAKPQSAIEKSIQTSIAVRPPRDQVASIAYQIYVQEGRPQGRELRHWLEAEARLAAVPR
jgi:DUF2934 family protein